MTKRKIATGVHVPLDRYSPPQAYPAYAQAARDSGSIDWLLLPDQMTSWWPTALWTEENTPIAAMAPDCDSWPDAVAMAAYSAATVSDVGFCVSADAVRRGPAELYQSMLTLSNVTGGRAMLQIGAGELKQAKPFGHKRSQGLARLEDLFKAWDHWATKPNEPLTMEGNYWNLTNASLGGQREFRPEIWALGGGPKLVDLATTYADGFSTMSPFAWPDAEIIAERIGAMKLDLEKKGRDPEAFGFGTWVLCQVHEDDDVVAQALDNPLSRWMTAAFGRTHQPDWRREGLEPIFPDDWHYATKLLPVEYDAARSKSIIDRVTPEMGRKAWLHGSPKKVATEIQSYIDAGMNWILVGDFLPAVRPPEDPTGALANSAEVCSLIKANNPA
ncbi:hypothetical protein MycrhDRAFT_1613 [Mycolicibacterium rhodesiae JS60]|nr:hypothetical protein MycrhDRAFT_1613 [Mycolicibacterium rhodesiae JS60]